MAAGEISIRPTTSVYATYQRLSYKPWFAIAEFVDNSTQSYFDHRDALLAAFRESCPTEKLRIEITYDPEEASLTVLDNAFGMEVEDLWRALALNSPPPNRAGRSEFGMGLKTAACWFGKRWSIETTQLGSSRKLRSVMDVMSLADHPVETVPFTEQPAAPEEHFTRLTITDLNHPIRGRTLGRVLDQLSSIYRQDLRSGEIEIVWNLQPVAFEEAPILIQILEDGSVREWKKPVSLIISRAAGEPPLPVNGWIALRDPGKQRDAGFVLFRRNRVIIGGPDEGYRPAEVFGAPNLYRSQRLIGELHMDAWPVTQAKDGFDWAGDLEDRFIDTLRQECKEYGDFAEAYRSGQQGTRISPAQMQAAAAGTQKLLASGQLGSMLLQEAMHHQPGRVTPPSPRETQNVREVSYGPLVYTLPIGPRAWIFRLHWQDQVSDAHWMQLSQAKDDEIDIYLNTAHPFFASYLGQPGMVELLQKLVIALALAEQFARSVSTNGLVEPSDFRNYMNMVLRRVSMLASGRTNGS